MTIAWIRNSVQCHLEHSARHALPNETGGLLVGYRADNGELVIHDVVGPGPHARHSSVRFVPDHAWQCDRLDAIYHESNGRFVYLGDWHTHTSGIPEMSSLDRRTLRKIAQHPGISSSPPVMLIGGNVHGGWSWKVHEYRSSSLFGLRVVTESLPLRKFG
jgi:integrative and conjugative element protein (TIGR02256 family)